MKRFLIDVSKNYIRTAMTNLGELIELVAEERSDGPRVGDIYAARVEKVIKKQHAFVNIGAEKNGFLNINGVNIQQGQAIVVRVEKPAYGEKGCMLSLFPSLSGKLAAVTSDGRPIGISHKITDDETRARLLAAVKQVLPNGLSCVVRTNAAQAAESELQDEIKRLSAELLDIIENGKYAKPPYRLYRSDDDTLCLLRDCMNEDDEILVNDAAYLETVKRHFPKAKLYDGSVPLFSEYGIESRIDKLLQRKVWLNCGGFLIFDYTEAMTVVDVNTGKFTDGGRNAALKTNIEAAKEIAKQMRLRNLSGMVLVDFVNMKHKDDIEALEAVIQTETAKDRLKTVYAGLTSLGIAQFTRQKQRVPLHTLFKTACKTCSGSGEVTNYRCICDKVRNKIINIFADTIYTTVSVKGNEALISFLKKNGDIEGIEKKFGKAVVFEAIETGAADYFEVGFDVSAENK